MPEPTAAVPDPPESAPAWPEEHPELLPFLPLVYVAWADGVLTTDELDAIRDRLGRQSWLTDEARERLLAWMRPDRPPPATALAALRERIRELAPEEEESGAAGEDGGGAGGGGGAPQGGAAGVADASGGAEPGSAAARRETRRSLVSLGLDLARARGAEAGWDAPDARAALEELEEALGVRGEEAARELLGRGPDAAASRPRGPGQEDRGAAAASGRPSFDAEALAAWLDEPHADLRRRVRALLERDELDFPYGLEPTDYRERVRRALRLLAEEGLGGLAFPKAYGGGGDAGAAIAVFETLAFGDLSLLVKYGVHFGLFGGAILQLGTRKHHEAYLRRVADLDLPGCFAMTEAGHGSNVRELETTATYDPDGEQFVVHTPTESARKVWIGNASLHGRMAVVFAQLRTRGEDHGVHAFLVPIRSGAHRLLEGVEIVDMGRKIGLNGVDNGMIRFDEVRVPREALLDRFATVAPDGSYESPIPGDTKRFFTMLGTLVAGRISIAAASVSAAKRGLAAAVRHGERRRQFGPAGGAEVPVLDYLAHQRLLLPRLAKTYAVHFAVRELVEAYGRRMRDTADGRAARRAPGDASEDEQREARRQESLAAGLKAYASWHTVDTLQACREAMGGSGYAASAGLGRLRDDTDVFTTFEGANPVLLQLVAKGLLSRYREEMGDLRLWDVVKYVGERAATRITELNPVATRNTDPDHLRDPEWHAAAFRYREERLLASVARRLKTLIDRGEDTFDALNATQDHVMALALAHVEREVLDAFRRGVERAPEGLEGPLDRLARLYALHTVEEHRGWYLESGYLEGGKAKAVRAEVNALCGEVRAEAAGLVSGFRVPPS